MARMIAVLCNVVLLDTLIEGGRLAGGGGSGSTAAAGAVPLGCTAGRPAGPAMSEIMSVFLRKHRLVG